jgi:hypothetical protein
MLWKPSPSQYHSTCKAITIGGEKGTVAWFDLWDNVILCDVLTNRPQLRSLTLPPLIFFTVIHVVAIQGLFGTLPSLMAYSSMSTFGFI